METSKLSIDKNILRIGDVVTYCDSVNFMTYEVSELFEGGAELKAISGCGVEGGEFEDIYFDSLQLGWELNVSNFERVKRA